MTMYFHIVGGVVRYRDLDAKIKIANFFPGVFVGDSRKFKVSRLFFFAFYAANAKKLQINAQLSYVATAQSAG